MGYYYWPQYILYSEKFNVFGKLFQKFYRIDNKLTREQEGTGLGLYICRSIIELYGGKIWIESEEGKGSKFIFTIPVAKTLKQPKTAKTKKVGANLKLSKSEEIPA